MVNPRDQGCDGDGGQQGRARGRAKVAGRFSGGIEGARVIDPDPEFPTADEGGIGGDPTTFLDDSKIGTGTPRRSFVAEGDEDGDKRYAQRRAEKDAKYKQRQLESFDNVKTTEGQTKLGTCGEAIRLTSNYVRVQQRGQWRLYHYHVSFTPELTMTREKKGVMRAFAGIGEGKLGMFIFDGHSLWTTTLLSPEIGAPIDLKGFLKNETEVDIQIKLVSELEPGDVMYLQFYSIVVRKCLELLKLDLMGRHYYDHTAAIRMENHRLELWPGFITTMRQHDAGLLYCVEITHKVVRLDTVFDYMTEIRRDMERNRGCQMDEVKESIKKELVGIIVLTSYNNLTYRVDDIAWDENACSTFPRGPDSEISYMDYFKEKYNVTIRMPKQPLLISNPKKADIRRGHKTPFKLIPELCRMTGMSDKLRQNFTLMRDMGRYLFQPPQEKVDAVGNFIRRLKSTPECQKEMNSWGLNLTTDMVEVQGRVIPREGIAFRDGASFPANEKADFTMAFRSTQMMTSVGLSSWVLIVPQREASNVDNLIRTMSNVGRPLGFDVQQPMDMIQLHSVNPQAYAEAIKNIVAKHGKRMQMIFVILANNSLDAYSAVKRRCYIDYGVPSQCFLSKNLKAKGLMSIATKVVIQMNAKLGGEPWNVKIPLKGLMIVGFDVHKSGSGSKRTSIGAMASTTSDSFGRYFSCVSFFSNLEDLSGSMALDITKCLCAYKKVSGALPARIIFYRDGVGEGQLHYVFHTELEAIKARLNSFYEEASLEIPKFTFIICTKKINTRFFVKGRNGYDNAPPGTVADNAVTIPERFDFFLLSHAARQGTVSPTNYNVLWDRNELEADKIQRLTFKMCHLYYNWSGGISIPAVVQYAHKLAYLTGLSLQSEASANLSHMLYFL